MKNEAIDKFLLGTADDNQQRQCEELLANPETVVDCQPTMSDDSLLNALRADGTPPLVNSDTIRQLAEKIESLVPRQAISPDELKRLLNPSPQPDDLGMIGRYRVIEFLASGGMGLVFRAIDPELNRPVCIKLLNPNHGYNSEAKTRFDREARAAARMTCERIMPVLEIGRQRELPFLVMPMLEGVSLRTILTREQRIAPDRAIQIAKQIAEGLDYAHQREILHRDIKPDNLWITPTGDIKLLDFGLARTSDDMAPITKAGTVLGTPSYMSPEQITGKSLDGRSDLFSLGVVLVEMLTGQSPFQKTNLFSTLMSVAGDEIRIDELDPANEIPLGLRDVVQRLLKKNAGERIGSAGELIRLFDQVQSEPERALTAPTASTGSRWWKTIAAALAGFAICLSGLAIWNSTDKGTLVVQTADPAVEIRIANERVSIHDPVTDRNYEIRIGETPLPSGVYQLETTDSTGDLVFSSQTITIRRGEKAIVTVEMRSPVSLTDNPLADAEPAKILAEKTADNTPWADRSRSLTVRENFATILPTLRAIEVLDRKKNGWPSFQESSNTIQKANLPGIDAWSIEPPVTRTDNQHANCDRTLFLRYDYRSNFVCVSDANGNAKYFLPFRGFAVSTMEFDTTNPGLLATCSLQADPSKLNLDNLPPDSYEITIWRLSDNHAEVLYRFAASHYSIAWDRGYRLAYFKDRKLQFFRLESGISFPVDGTVQEKHSTAGLSPDARYFTSRAMVGEQYQLSIWDLKKGQFALAIPDADKCQWNEDDKTLAVFERQGRAFGIWDVDLLTLTKRVELPPAPDNYDSPKYILWKALENNFHRLAWMSREGELIVKNLDNNRQGKVLLGELVGKGKKVFQWQTDGSLLISEGPQGIRWVENESEVHGQIKFESDRPASTTAENESESRTPLRFGTILNCNDNRAQLLWGAPNDEKKKNGSRTIVGNVNLESQSVDPGVVEYGPGMLNPDGVSPNGKFMIRINATDATGGQFSNTPQISLETLDTGKTLHDFGEFRNYGIGNSRGGTRTVWSNNSRYLAISGQKHALRRENRMTISAGDHRLMVFDTLKKELVDCVSLGLPDLDAGSVTTWDDGFLVEIIPDGRSPISQAWVIDLEKQTATQSGIFSDFVSFNLIWHKDDEIIFTGRRPDDEPLVWDSEVRRKQRFFKGTIENGRIVSLKILEVLEFDYVTFSADGKYAMRVWYDDGKVAVRGSMRSFSAGDRQAIGFFNWNDPNSKASNLEYANSSNSRFSQSKWHQSSNVAAWEEAGLLFFFDVESHKTRNCVANISSIISTDFGWLASVENRLIAFDPVGKIIGQMTFDEFLKEGQPTNPRWILADGSMQAKASREGLSMVYCRDNRVYCEPLAEFVANPENPKLPTFDRVPFLKNGANE